MLTSINYATAVLCACVSILITAPAAACAAGSVIVIEHVTVVPMHRDGIMPDQSVLIEGGRITAMAPAGLIHTPRDATRIDGRGKFLMPGLVDFHTHPRGDTELAMYRLFGVTRVLALSGEVLGWRTATRKRVLDGVLPTIVSSGRPFDGDPPLSRRFYALAQAQQVEPAVANEQVLGAALIKTYSKLAAPMLTEIARHAHARGMPVIGHTPWNSSPEDVLNGGLDVVAHGEELFQYLGDNPLDEQIASLVSLMSKGDVALVVNIIGYVGMIEHAYELERVLQQPEVAFLAGMTYHEWQPRNNVYANRKDLDVFRSRLQAGRKILHRIALAAHRAGVTLLAGTDVPTFCFPGECMLAELELLAQSGLSNYEALRTATVNPARVLSKFKSTQARFGAVQVGNDADLVLLAANPLDDLNALRRVAGVMIRGEWISAAQMTAARDSIRERAVPAHRLVHEYESLFAADRIAELIHALRDTAAEEFPALSVGFVLRDANVLAERGRVADAIRLVTAAESHVASTPGLYASLGDLKAKTGDLEGARREYRRALDMMPGNASFEAAMHNLRASTGSTH